MSVVADNKCPSCGANIKFNPSTQRWDCEYCGSSITLEEFEKIQEKEEGKEWENKKINIEEYNCPNCGAVVVTDENTLATHCVYCGNTTIIKNRLQGEFKPDKIIPFKTQRQDAIDAFQRFVERRWFAPKEFQNKENIEKISGVYIPFWLYDCSSEGSIVANAKKVRRWSSGSYEYTETEIYRCIREGKAEFIDLPVDGSTKFEDDIMDSIEPYDYEEFTKFNRSYLSGFLAEKYDLNNTEVYHRAEERITNTIINDLRETINGYSSVKVTNSEVNIEKGKIEYALLPVWMMNINYKDKMYTFAMNGQTKKMVGNVPIEPKKLIGGSLAMFILTTILSIIGNSILGIL